MTKFTRLTPEELAKRLEEITNGTGEPYIPGEDPLVDLAMDIQDTAPPQMPTPTIRAIGAAILLENRLAEITNGTGEPYIPGEDPALDAAMRLQNAPPIEMPAETVAAIEASLMLATSATTPPQLSDKAFHDIEQMLQTQLQLQSTTPPRLSDEAFNRIEQQLLDNATPQTPYLSLIAALLVLLGVVLTGVILLPDDDLPPPEATEDTMVDDNSEYTSMSMAVEHIASTPEPIVDTEEASPEVETEAIDTEAEPDVEPTDPPITIDIMDVMELPAAVSIDGPITSLEDDTVVIYNFTFSYEHDATLLDNYAVGDMVHIDGAEHPYEDETYLILNIEPVYVANADIARPHVVSSISDDTSDTTAVTTSTDNPIVTSATTSTGTSGANSTTAVTGGSTSNTSSSSQRDDCSDGSDRNRGRGQECNNRSNGN